LFLLFDKQKNNLVRWQLDNGASERINPTLHKSQVSGLAISGEQLVSVGWDDSIAFTTGVFDKPGMVVI
jgi:hypothetical protein